MIVVDTSALMAVMLREDDEADMLVALVLAREVGISAMNDFETRVVTRSRGGQIMVHHLDVVLRSIDAVVLPFDAHQAVVASEAHARFGKGNHPARLNLADCAAYALAKSLDAPLLFKGSDFSQTDIIAAVSPEPPLAPSP